MTAGRVLVRIQGKEYVASCNRCGWVCHFVRRTLGLAQRDHRTHVKSGQCAERLAS